MSYIDRFTSSLLHFNGVHISGTIIDEAGGSWTRNNGATYISRVDSAKFGTTCLKLGGGGGIQTADRVGFRLGRGDMTTQVWGEFDFWLRFTTLQSCNLISKWSPSGAKRNEYRLDVAQIGSSYYLKFRFYISDSAGYGPDYISTGAIPDDGAWHHYAFVLVDTSAAAFYIDGVRDSIQYIGQMYYGENDFIIGGDGAYSLPYLHGAIDEFRFSIARRASGSNYPIYPWRASRYVNDPPFVYFLESFTLPTAPYKEFTTRIT
jgi:hypothetical protein